MKTFIDQSIAQTYIYIYYIYHYCMPRNRFSFAFHKMSSSKTNGSLDGQKAVTTEAAWVVQSSRKSTNPKRKPFPSRSQNQQNARRLSNGSCADYNGRRPPAWMVDMVYQPPPPMVYQGQQRQHILMLVGMPGSGKTTLSETLCIVPWKYQHVNQDILRSRPACLKRIQALLDEGCCPIIDRCNVSREQRNFFTDFTLRSDDATIRGSTVPVDCIVLKSASIDACISRCQARGSNHPTLEPQNVVRVVRAMQKEWQEPNHNHEPRLRSIIAVFNDTTLQQVVHNILEDAVQSSQQEEEQHHSAI
jgi:AAA domain